MRPFIRLTLESSPSGVPRLRRERGGAQRDLLTTIPGIGPLAAAAVIAEIGADVRGYFPGAAHLASWAGLCPANSESAWHRPARRRKGNEHLQSLLVECAWAAVRHPGYLKSLYHRHVMKWGGYRSQLAKKKAIIVVAHALIVIISLDYLAVSDLTVTLGNAG